ncbi:MAG: 23S rRNA (pseudouridine(1915)-N(3))-methyltransferase RlmH [Alphaproteobacteria bacterium]|nr:MAG: 23S rRNA (pseudouridine(1915)-N(3))-methyltransferase RlmH [Alphaproteobacteria bacterium]
MKIRIIAVGKMKKSPLLDQLEEYLKRMNWKVSLKEIDTPKGASSAQEEPLILKHLKPGNLLVALDERGESLTSPDFAAKLSKWGQQAPGNEVTFLIGGADGLTDGIRKKAKFLLSFGKQTWPHMLVRVMLVEQVYRAQQIIAGHPYHRV